MKKQDLVKAVFKEHSKLLPVVMEGAKKHLKSALSITVEEVSTRAEVTLLFRLKEALLILENKSIMLNCIHETADYVIL